MDQVILYTLYNRFIAIAIKDETVAFLKCYWSISNRSARPFLTLSPIFYLSPMTPQ
jgi:hypothetical protein